VWTELVRLRTPANPNLAVQAASCGSMKLSRVRARDMGQIASFT
jgi:hypothetical protein